ncbi:MAG: redoxin family protein [Propionibacteriales bacterium]|nr:redoxin family protein [Propionibacteriales bacterium]
MSSERFVMSRPTLAAFAVAVAGVLALAGCGGQDAAQSSESAESSKSSESAPGEANRAESAQSTLTFTATTVDGKEFDAAELGGRPSVLWFWAPWCPTCMAQSSYVLGLAEEHGEAVNIVGVASLGALPEMEEFIDRTKTADLTHLDDGNGEVWRHFDITAQSTFALVDESGVVTYSGYLEPEDLRQRVATLVG